MIQTKYGIFDGNTWEELCQLVFKRKYGDDNYQEMPASPGDFGIEGFIKNKGVAFQCYCPDKHYTQKELYDKQRDKITKDLDKLKKYEADIKVRLGDSTIKEWVFLTPQITDNELLKHAQKRQIDLVGLDLSIISPEFKVILKDADFYAKEINEIRLATGNKLMFLTDIEELENAAQDSLSDYEDNISRKNEKRCTFDGELNRNKHAKLNRLTSKKWTDGDLFLRQIEKDASEVYFQIIRVISQYENEVEELCITWQGNAEELVVKIKYELGLRIGEAIPSLGEAERYKIADQVTSKWLALCPLDIE